jgi:hypothetical protein
MPLPITPSALHALADVRRPPDSPRGYEQGAYRLVWSVGVIVLVGSILLAISVAVG